MSKADKVIAIALGAIGILIIGSIVNGFVLRVLWGWFILDIFPAAPHISIVQAIGLTLVTGWLKGANTKQRDEDASGLLATLIAWQVLYPALMLGIGFIVKMFL